MFPTGEDADSSVHPVPSSTHTSPPSGTESLVGSTYETLRQPLIHYFTHTVGEDDAEDLCHDLFLTLIGRLAQRVQIQAMDHYLWRAARFRAIDTQPGALWARERRREPFGRGGFCRERRRERRRDPFGRGGLAPPAYP